MWIFTPGVRYMLASAFCFSIMGALVKLAGHRLPSQEIVLARSIVSLVIGYLTVVHAGVSIWGTHKALLCLRGFFGFIALACVFYALIHLPLAEATVIQYLHPMFTALLAAVILREAVGLRLFASLLLSSAGVLLVARPTTLFGDTATGLRSFDVMVAIAGAFFSACAYIVVRYLSTREHPHVIVFYFPLVTIPLTLPSVASNFVMPQGMEWLVLLGIGVVTQLGQIALTYGMRHETAARATGFSYMQVVFAAFWGILFFQELPDAWVMAGAACILGGSLLNLRYTETASRDEVAPR